MPDNNDWDIDDYDVPDVPTGDATPPAGDNGTGGKEPKPTKLSRGATGLLIVGLLIIVVLILITIKGCSVEKQTNKPANQGSANLVTTPSILEPENSGTSEVNNLENPPVSSEVSSTPVEIPNEGNSSQVSEQITISQPEVETSTEITTAGSISEGSNEDVLSEVGQPQLSTELETNGIVIGKHVFYYKESYIYGVYVSILFGDTTKSVWYFCPKKTFDALSSADAIRVTYAFDSVGNISISTISK